MTYATLETSRHSGQPLELYKFVVARPATVGSGDVLVASDGLEYENQAAMEAAGWTLLDEMTGVGSSNGDIAVAATDQVYAGAFSVKMAAIGTGALAGSERLKATRVFSGLTAGVLHTVTVRGRMNAWSHFDNHSGLWVKGKSGDSAAVQSVNTWQLLTQQGTATGGTLTVALQRQHPYITQTRDTWWDKLEIWRVADPESLPRTEYHYTSADTSIAFQGDTYAPAVFTRTAIRSGDGEGLEAVELTLPRDHAIAQLFHGGLPVAPVSVTIYRVHRADAAAGTSYITPFIGQVDRARFEGPSCVLTLASLRSFLERKHPSLLVQGRCPWMLYDGRCQVSKESFAFATTVTAVNDFAITLAGLATNAGTDTTKYQFGFVVGPSGEHVFIERQDGDVVTVLTPPQTLAAGDAVTVYAGCDRTAQTCHDRFANIAHIGARPLMPKRNPFGPTGMIT